MFWNVFKKKLKSFLHDDASIDYASYPAINDKDISDSIEYLTDFSSSNKLFLGRFNSENLFSKMEKVGLIKHLKSLGFEHLLIDIDMDKNRISYMKLYWKERLPENQLIDLRVSEKTFIPDKKYFDDKLQNTQYNMIVIEWLSAKNPLKSFDSKKPQLPGQTNPGLGVLKYCFKMLYIMAKEVYKDGFLDIPNHMHGAIMYSKKFRFFDPAHEGVIRAMRRDLQRYSLSDITWGAITGTIIDLSTNKPAIYDPCEQIHYASAKMKNYFESRNYKNIMMKYYEKKKYFFDYREMLKMKEKILQSKKIEDL